MIFDARIVVAVVVVVVVIVAQRHDRPDSPIASQFYEQMSILFDFAIGSGQSIGHYRFQTRLLQSRGLILETSLQALDRLHQHLPSQSGQLMLEDLRILSVYGRVCGQPFLPKPSHFFFQRSPRIICERQG